MKKIDWNKVAVLAALHAMVFVGMLVMIVVFALVESITPCDIC